MLSRKVGLGWSHTRKSSLENMTIWNPPSRPKTHALASQKTGITDNRIIIVKHELIELPLYGIELQALAAVGNPCASESRPLTIRPVMTPRVAHRRTSTSEEHDNGTRYLSHGVPQRKERARHAS